MFIAINRTFTDDYLIKYSELERRATVERDRSPDRPCGAGRARASSPGSRSSRWPTSRPATGLGSSGAFTVGLLRAVYAFKREHVTAGALAEEAAQIEIDVLGEPVGKQDQYIAAFGGLTCFEIDRDGRVAVSPLGDRQRDPPRPRGAPAAVLHRATRGPPARSSPTSSAGRWTTTRRCSRTSSAPRSSGSRSSEALEADEPPAVRRADGRALASQARALAGDLEPGDRPLVRGGVANGALGGKLVGAGRGGFLMFYADRPCRAPRRDGGRGAARDAVFVRPRRLDRDRPRLTVAADVELLAPPDEVETDQVELSIVIPALNEELTIADFVAWCQRGPRRRRRRGRDPDRRQLDRPHRRAGARRAAPGCCDVPSAASAGPTSTPCPTSAARWIAHGRRRLHLRLPPARRRSSSASARATSS